MVLVGTPGADKCFSVRGLSVRHREATVIVPVPGIARFSISFMVKFYLSFLVMVGVTVVRLAVWPLVVVRCPFLCYVVDPGADCTCVPLHVFYGVLVCPSSW